MGFDDLSFFFSFELQLMETFFFFKYSEGPDFLKQAGIDEFRIVLGGQPTPFFFVRTEFAKSNFYPAGCQQ